MRISGSRTIVRLLIALLVVVFAGSAWAETMFVQSVKAALRADPQMTAADVETLARGDEVQVLETKGTWLRVKAVSKADKVGWLSKLFVGKNKPIGAASLSAEVPVSEAKTSRRRESSYAVSAATRGLMPVQRTRDGRENYRSNNQALDTMERTSVSEGEVEKFLREGKLRN